jgi:tRNA U34 5-carboxymethylaminomethyl modifying GTPase MnmE/TrmE
MTALPDLSATICALATPPGEGALGVIRVSGPRALEVVQPLTPKLLLCLGCGEGGHERER